MSLARFESWRALYYRRPFGIRGRELHTAMIVQSILAATNFSGSPVPSLDELAMGLNFDPDERAAFAERLQEAKQEKVRRTMESRGRPRKGKAAHVDEEHR